MTNLIRTAIILTCGLAASVAGQLHSRRAKFDPAAFRARYELAFHNQDIRFFNDLFSNDFWVGRQFPTRSASLSYLRGLFAECAATDARLQTEHIRKIAGGRVLAVDSTLSLACEARRAKAPITPVNTIGTSFFIYEGNRWRIYKNVERLAPETQE